MAVENYTTYSEYDASGLVTVAANTLTVAGNNNTAFSVHKVFAAGHFSGDFEHVVATKINNDGENNSSYGVFWGLSNKTSDEAHSPKKIDEANEDVLYAVAQEYTNDKVAIILREVVAGTQYQSFELSLSLDTWYYCEIERDESTGTYGTLLCRIYSDESRTTLLKTLSVTLHEKEDFRTLYACASYYNGGDRPYSQEIKNLDLQEVGTIKSYSVAAGDDDGHCVDGKPPYLLLSQICPGDSQGGVTNEGFMRFTDVDIPAGATITAAKIVFIAATSNFDGGATPSGTIKGRKVANCPQMTTWSTYGDTGTYPWTTATVTYWPNSTAWPYRKKADTPDIKTIIQEIIDLDGWVSGNAIQIAWRYVANGWLGSDEEDYETSDLRGFYSYNDSTYDPPMLIIEYTESKRHVYEATGAITLPALEVSGEAAKKHIYEVTGAIELPALEVAGQATRFHTWEVTGAITLPALEVSGTAQSSSGKVTHEVIGAIVLPALEVSGEATRFHSWEVTGAVTLPALEVDGQAEIAISLAGGGETDFQVYSSEDEDYVTGMALVDGGLLLNVDWKQRATEAECL